jgi:hypothetical protein
MELSFDLAFFSSLFNKLDDYQLSYAYSGEFIDSLTGHILSLVETSMEVESETSKTKKKVYYIMVESLQNITRHQSNTIDRKTKEGFFSIHKTKLGYLVTSGNLVKKSNIEALREKIEKINSLNQDELRDYHKEMLSAAELSEKGGAGLGLLEMLRKSGSKLNYDFVDVNETFSFFYFQAKVALNTIDTEDHPAIDNVNTLLLAQNIHNIILDHNLKTIFHGQFGHDNIKGLLAMTESNVATIQNTKLRKSVISVMIELLQNICYHADGKKDYEGEGPGLFVISEGQNCLSLITVNYIENSKTKIILDYVEKINNMEDEKVKALYLEILMKDDVDRKHGGGLGLLDIRHKTNNKIDIAIEPCNEELSYLNIVAHISF